MTALTDRSQPVQTALTVGVALFGAIDLALGVVRLASQARVAAYTYVQGPIWLWATLRVLIGAALIVSAGSPRWAKRALILAAIFWTYYASMIAEAVVLPDVTISAPATELAIGAFHLVYLLVYSRSDRED